VSACIERAAIARHFAGTLPPGEEHALREHLEGCAPCRLRYERHLLLSRVDPGALAAEERIARGLGLGVTKRPSVGRGVAAAVAVAAAAAAALLLVVRAPHDAGFTARGAKGRATRDAQHEAGPRLFLYDVRGAAPRPLRPGDDFPRTGELALAYQNGIAKTRLMVYAVDEHAHVYWFYPAWTSDADDPVAVPIATDEGRHELPDAVRHPFDGAKLEVHALFLDAPVSVRQVEALVSKQPAGPLSLPGAVETMTPLSISP
jgi:hypothetical protein